MGRQIMGRGIRWVSMKCASLSCSVASHVRRGSARTASRVMGTNPLVNLLEAARRSPVALGLIAVALLQEGLVLAFEVVLGHHALDAGALGMEAIGVTQVGPIELRVVGQLTSLRRPG